MCKEELEPTNNPDSQVVSRKRVVDHGEVYTNEREVNAMLDLVKQETGRIESRFLEPACGTGNFLAEVLKRKLTIVESRYGKSQLEFERYAILAVTSVYGIDLLEDNVDKCRERLLALFNERYDSLYKISVKSECKATVQYVLKKNIICGDALSLQTVGDNAKPIIFSEWSPVNGNMIKRRDFSFRALLSHAGLRELPLFSDQGDEVFIPNPVKDYPLIHFLRLVDAE
ncbi:MAG: SAM-dependent DNA methyltransferase [Deltaproteobacteria bacterium]|nr:SAM-dependent DNA methyltransferase [Deltaproteobacteria bacterium]